MTHLIIKENSPQAKIMLEYLKMMPYVEVIENEKFPNAKTLKAMKQSATGKLKSHKTVKSLMEDLMS
ncbi:MAG: hypothetical protein ACOYOV_13500 [Bacteroidales bacterium]